MLRRFHLWSALLLVLLAVSGCGGAAPKPSPVVEAGPGSGGEAPKPGTQTQPELKTEPSARLQPQTRGEPSLSTLLGEPRAELAKRVDRLLEQVQLQEKNRQLQNRPFTLYGLNRLPLILPVWRQAQFSSAADYSLPPYHTAGKTDPVLAVHLARWGDLEAARKLVGPADAGALEQIEALKLEQNYPLEWTRLVALRLHQATWALATGEAEAAQELAALRKELLEVLGPKTQASLLGRDLLARGWGVLHAAVHRAEVAKLSQPHTNQLSEQLRAWPQPKLLALDLPLPRARAENWFGAAATGYALQSRSPLRILDLLNLPFSEEGAQGAVGLLDGNLTLTQILLLYQPNLDRGQVQGETLAVFRAPGKAKPEGDQQYDLGQGVTGQLLLTPGNYSVGAIVELDGSGTEPQAVQLPRDLGPIHLSRSFETNRLRFAPQQLAEPLHMEVPDLLKQLTLPALPLPLTQARLLREDKHNLVRRLELQYGRDQPGRLPFPEMMGKLGERLGPVKMFELFPGKTVAVGWNDSKTFWLLGLPAGREETTQLAIGPVRPDNTAEALTAQARQAEEFERAERRKRSEAGKPWAYLPRALEKVELGQLRPQVEKTLAALAPQVHREQGDLTLVVLAGPAVTQPYQPREYLVRFDRENRVASIRVRYTTGTDVKSGGVQVLLTELKKKYGQVASLTAPQAPGDQSARYQWRDDVSLLDALPGPAGLELHLRARPLDPEKELARPPVQILSRGPAKAQLGTYKLELYKFWDVISPPRAGEAEQFNPKSGPFDVLLVWFDRENRVTRVQARHANLKPSGRAAASQAVLEGWGSQFHDLGWAWEQQSDREGLRSCGNRDGFTRVQTFWQESGGVMRVFTQWEALAMPGRQ